MQSGCTNPVRDTLTAYFWSGDTIRSRSVSDVVLTGTVEIPALPARLITDWERDIAQRLGLEPGDVEEMPLARARMRWPDYPHCVRAVSEWTHRIGLEGVLADSDIALMACRGARYHHDGAQYGGAAFCNVFVSDDKGLDVHFPATGHRIPLVRGTVLVFDTGQPHAVIDRRSDGFNRADFSAPRDCSQLFLTWEIAIEDPHVARVLGVEFDTDTATALTLDEEQVRRHGAALRVCPDTGGMGS
jgi:hypothetical protein